MELHRVGLLPTGLVYKFSSVQHSAVTGRDVRSFVYFPFLSTGRIEQETDNSQHTAADILNVDFLGALIISLM